MGTNAHFLLALTLTFISLGAVSSASEHVNRERPSLRQLSVETQVREGVQTNFIGVLSDMVQTSAVAGTNVSRAAAILIRGIVREGFSLGSVATYLPRLIFLDGPSQFIETLRLIRSNQVRIPQDSDEAIDILINYAGSFRDSGIANNFAPVVTIFPNLFTGVETFVQELLYTVFAWWGPIPSTAQLDNKIQEQQLRIVSTTTTPKSNETKTR